MSNSPKNFVWYELMTTDMEAAETFYHAVVGWSPQNFNQPDMRYTVMSAGDKMVAGLMTLPPEVCAAGGRPGWVGYIGVDDVDAATAGVKKAGGAVHRPAEDIPNIGRFSVVADPQCGPAEGNRTGIERSARTDYSKERFAAERLARADQKLP